MITSIRPIMTEKYDLERVADKLNRLEDMAKNGNWSSVYLALTDSTNYDLTASLPGNIRNSYLRGVVNHLPNNGRGSASRILRTAFEYADEAYCKSDNIQENDNQR